MIGKVMNKQANQAEQIRLEKFNRMIQQYQDEAYTLAYYFFGNEAEAVEAVESAVQKAYRAGKDRSGPFNLRFYRYVISECQRRKEITQKVQTEQLQDDVPDVRTMISRLPIKIRTIVILIDLLGLRYQEAAMVCNLPVVMVQKLTAEARASLC